jgi:hypothetical protein
VLARLANVKAVDNLTLHTTEEKFTLAERLRDAADELER